MHSGFKVIDADAHFYEPPDIWDKYMVGEDLLRPPPPGGQGPWQGNPSIHGWAGRRGR